MRKSLILYLLLLITFSVKSQLTLVDGLTLSTYLMEGNGVDRINCFMDLRGFKYDRMASLIDYQAFSRWSRDSVDYETFWIDKRSGSTRVVFASNLLGGEKIDSLKSKLDRSSLFLRSGNSPNFYQLRITENLVESTSHSGKIYFQSVVAVSEKGLLFFYPPTILKKGVGWNELLISLLFETWRQ